MRNVTFVFYSWSMLIHMRREGLRDGQKMTKTRTTGGWQYRDVCNIPAGMFSADEIQRLLIGCCTQVGGSAVRTSHIRSDPTMCQAVVAAPVTGSLVSISWLNLRETARNVFSPQKRTNGGTDQSKGIVFLVWIQLITEDCSMNTATSVLPWDARGGGGCFSGRRRDSALVRTLWDWRAIQDTQHGVVSCVAEIFVVFVCLFQWVEGLIRAFMM